GLRIRQTPQVRDGYLEDSVRQSRSGPDLLKARHVLVDHGLARRLVRERRDATDRVTSEALRLVGRGTSHPSRAEDLAQPLLADAPVAAAQHDDRSTIPDENKRLHDLANTYADLARRILRGASAGSETADLDRHAALGCES